MILLEEASEIGFEVRFGAGQGLKHTDRRELCRRRTRLREITASGQNDKNAIDAGTCEQHSRDDREHYSVRALVSISFRISPRKFSTVWAPWSPCFRFLTETLSL